MHRRKLVLGVVVAVLSMAGIACQQAAEAADLLGEINPERPECPHGWHAFRIPPKQGSSTPITINEPNGFSVPGDQTNIPEYNDCQRIIKTDGATYGTLMGVFASDLLDTVFLHARSDTAVAVVQVLNYSAEYEYNPLGIKPVFNCLYLWQTATGNFRARMLPFGEKQCDRTMDSLAVKAVAAGTYLAVIPSNTGAFTTATGIPPVARWDWDAAARVQFIGVRCGPQWCNVGPASDPNGLNPAFAQSQSWVAAPASLAGMTAAAIGDAKTMSVQGWYDQQRLAEIGTAAPTASKLVGTVFPRYDLNSHDGHPIDFKNRFVVTAYAALDVPTDSGTSVTASRYKTKYNFDPVPAGSGLAAMAEIALCRGSLEKCSVPTADRPKVRVNLAACVVTPGTGRGRGRGRGGDMPNPEDLFPRWWTRIVSRATGDTLFRCNHQRSHAGVVDYVPGTSRWRWLVADETVWHECLTGCCEVEVK